MRREVPSHPDSTDRERLRRDKPDEVGLLAGNVAVQALVDPPIHPDLLSTEPDPQLDSELGAQGPRAHQ